MSSACRAFGVALLLLVVVGLYAQQPDKVLTFSEYMYLVNQYHPVAKQAGLLSEKSRQQLIGARGGFDPKIFATFNEKNFKQQDYFLHSQSGVSIPAWFGLEVKAMYELNRGVQLNPENKVPTDGIAQLGVSMPVGQGLFFDQRRADLKQAKIFENLNDAERVRILNDLYFNAAKTYWQWALLYANMQVYQQAAEIALERFNFTRQSFLAGDKPAIDTVESLVQYQSFQVQSSEAQLAFRNQGLQVSNFLWFEGQPLQVTDSLQPADLSTMKTESVLNLDSLSVALDAAAENHPLLRQYNYKLDMLDVEKRLKIEKLKPKINVNYNLLTADRFAFEDAPERSIFTENYKWGVEFSMPLFWGKGRSGLGLTKLKIMETNFALSLKTLEVDNKVIGYFNQLITLSDQIEVYGDITTNYNTLLQAEETRFQIGESSMFLVNQRQQKLIQAQLKLLKLKAGFMKAEAGYRWSQGVIPFDQ